MNRSRKVDRWLLVWPDGNTKSISLCLECCDEIRRVDSEVQFRHLRFGDGRYDCQRCEMLLRKSLKEAGLE